MAEKGIMTNFMVLALHNKLIPISIWKTFTIMLYHPHTIPPKRNSCNTCRAILVTSCKQISFRL